MNFIYKSQNIKFMSNEKVNANLKIHVKWKSKCKFKNSITKFNKILYKKI